MTDGYLKNGHPTAFYSTVVQYYFFARNGWYKKYVTDNTVVECFDCFHQLLKTLHCSFCLNSLLFEIDLKNAVKHSEAKQKKTKEETLIKRYVINYKGTLFQ